ncbi:glycoside hydrolase superfamily [Mycena rebaudengoi]|nr:glycoside hydrolase superfamily [Mycena rebaudengoi]
MKSFTRNFVFLIFASFPILEVYSADCKFATVGSPNSNCFDIAAAAGITTAQLSSFNPGLDCGLLQPGQKLCISTGTLPGIPKQNPDGSCATYKIKVNDSCSAIAAANSITVKQLESFNTQTYKWKGCAGLGIDRLICLSPGTPPPIPINPLLDCGPETKGNKTCPLNACCSAFGFCGLTSEFCSAAPNGDPCISNCGITALPSCGGGQLARKIGYYASWASRRKCQSFGPENLDLTGYTHVIYAFVNISPLLELSMTAQEESVLKGLVKRKIDFPNVKVLFAVGGWAFSTEDATRTIFTTVVSTAGSRTKFVGAIKQFLDRYQLDGVDIDFEYPSAMERKAPPSETADLTAFFKNCGPRCPTQSFLSLHLPVTGFEINKLQEFVTFINMMSYDYHGVETASPIFPNALIIFPQGEDHTAKPHTSAQDIEDSSSASLTSSSFAVNLGLAWYGRTFSVGSCTGLGCPMSGGGAPGPCTGESGILSQLEVKDRANGLTPAYNRTSMTYSYALLLTPDLPLISCAPAIRFNRGGDYITFDDETSWKDKTDLAKQRCFGGTFVWSLDQGTPTVFVTVTPTPTQAPQPTETVSIQCAAMSDTVRADCQRMVNDISVSNKYVKPSQSRTRQLTQTGTTLTPTSAAPLSASKPSVSTVAASMMDDWRDRDISAKEIKAAAQAILDSCKGNSLSKREIPPNVVESIIGRQVWNVIARINVASVIIGAVAVLKEVFDDKDERGDFILKTVTEQQQANPEWNVIGIHPSHDTNFEEPWHHDHVEFDRKDPLGTFGYEIYFVRRGTLRNKGDGGFVNWAFFGLWEKINDDAKFIKFSAPGTKYGLIGPIKAVYNFDGKDFNVDTAVCLGDSSGCGTCFLD